MVYDRFDVWKIDPAKKYSPINITVNGNQTHISYRVIDFKDDGTQKEELEQLGINPSKAMYLTGHNEITRNDGYYKIASVNSSIPVELMSGSYSLSSPIKAKGTENYIYTKETFDQFPDLLITIKRSYDV